MGRGVETFDFILVGAGSAGCVLARRLSEERSCRVLLLEAGGPDRRREIHVPAAFSRLFKGPCDWAYETEPEPNLAGRRLFWPRGKVLGGCSSINAMMWVRGHPSDYDGWERLGNPGWSYRDVLPYFLRAEDNGRGAGPFRGAGGPMPVNDLCRPDPLSRRFLEACAEAGIEANDDFNGPRQEGAGLYQVTQRNGARASAAAAYLRPALSRPNLVVRTSAHVRRIDVESGRAVGVECLHEGKSAVARAGEVILCGGAVNSPQLLMLSGIGPAAHLEAVGIRPVVDLPGVGENLQDHLMTGVCCACSARTLDGVGLLDLLRHLLGLGGRLTSNVGEAGAFVRTSPDLAAPDVQLIFAPAYYVRHGFENPKGAGYSVGAIVLRPRSRGRLRLRSADPLAPPRIEANYLAELEDLAAQLAGLRLARRLCQAKALAPVRLREHLPGEGVRDDDGLERYLREHSETLYHPVGTCRMGGDRLAVVDAELRVHGVGGLRVVDASIMPAIPGGNTNAPTIMIAEKAADLIRGRA
jgi:choline dehydrogenase